VDCGLNKTRNRSDLDMRGMKGMKMSVIGVVGMVGGRMEWI